MGARGPLPKKKALRVMSGQLPLTKANLQEGIVDFSPPDPPEDLTKEEKEIWDRTIELLRPLRLLEKIDAAVLGAYCCSYRRWRQAESELKKMQYGKIPEILSIGANGQLVTHPLLTISQKERAAMVDFARELGMTPAARMRVTVVKSKPKENPFNKLKKVKDVKIGVGKASD